MIRLKQILESKITETPLADILGTSSEEHVPNVLFIGDEQTAEDFSYANKLLKNNIVNGKITTVSNFDIVDLAKMIRQSISKKKYDVISILVPNDINRNVKRTIQLLEQIFKFAKRRANKVIAITNTINADSEDKKSEDLLKVAEWISTQDITDDVIDVTQFSDVNFKLTGNELTADGHTEIARNWKQIVDDYEFAYDDEEDTDIEDVDVLDTDKSKDKDKRKGNVPVVVLPAPVSVDSSDIVSGANFSDSLENQATRLLGRFEGFSSTPGWDVNAWRIGHGSSTITTADGEVIRLGNDRNKKPDYTITMDDADRDLKRRLQNEFIPQTLHAISPADDTLPAGIIAPLVSITYNYGTLPHSIKVAAQNSDIPKIVQTIRARENDNDGVNRQRRNKEANYVIAAAQAAGLAETNESLIKLKSLLKR